MELKALAVPGLKRPPGQANWDKFMASLIKESDDLAAELAKAKKSGPALEKWHERFSTLIYEGHTHAHALGRAQAGVFGSVGNDDRLVGRARLDAENEWLDEFIADLEDGRYGKPGTEEFKDAAVRQRQRLYMRKVRGTANEAFVLAGEADDIYIWTITPGENCPDCRALSGKEFTMDDAPTHPGLGDTECLAHCKCYWVRKSDGRSSLKFA